jgi:alkylation response protein AidB-like acyl-CoA dehydrogenase
MDYFDMDLGLSDEDRALKEAAHKFAAEVMRPAARELDRMSAEEAVAEDSPVWPFLRKAYELGYHKALLPGEAP